MKKRKVKKITWIMMTFVMCIALTTYVLVDAFLIADPIISVSDDRPLDPDPQPEPVDLILTATEYRDQNIHLTIETVKENGVVFYVVDVKLTDIKYLKSAFAKDTFGKNINESTSSIAKRHEAILAFNGDFYGFRDRGLIIRNGILFRDNPRKAPDNRALLIDDKGAFRFVTEGTVPGEDLLKQGVVHSLSFGPVLVENGVAQPIVTNFSKTTNPRTAIGMIEPLHYLIILVDGRTETSKGMRLETLADELVKRGVVMAYNLDGGGSSTLWFNGKLINKPTTDGKWIGERKVSDILFLGY